MFGSGANDICEPRIQELIDVHKIARFLIPTKSPPICSTTRVMRFDVATHHFRRKRKKREYLPVCCIMQSLWSIVLFWIYETRFSRERLGSRTSAYFATDANHLTSVILARMMETTDLLLYQNHDNSIQWKAFSRATNWDREHNDVLTTIARGWWLIDCICCNIIPRHALFSKRVDGTFD